MFFFLFTLETEFHISLKISEIDKEARKETGNAPFEIDGVITPEGLAALRKRVPEISQSKLKQGITIHEIVTLITVHSLCNAVIQKVNEKNSQNQN